MVLGKHVLYFAIQPPPEAAAAALARLQSVRSTGKPTAPGRLHVSLNRVGDFKRPPGPVVDKAVDAASLVDVRRFRVEFNQLGTWTASDKPRPVVLWGEEGVIGVNALYSAIHKALVKSAMVPRRETLIEPHMTLIYDKTEVPMAFVEPVSWRVDEFVLIHAVHGEGVQEVVGRFPLSD